jgi:DNA segregation ATPase FtsK/SpoIIIE-like protein
LVTIVDEFSGCDESEKLIRLIAEGRAVRMYFVLATQHPTADVLPTSIKSNLNTAIALRTPAPSSSRMVIGCADATRLLGRGDCLVRFGGKLTRAQAGWVRPADLGALSRPQ